MTLIKKNSVFKNSEQRSKNERYEKYRSSKDWEEIRKLILERDNHKCRCCASTERQLHIHHSTYEHLYDELNHLDDLITLCSVCHRAIHNKFNFQRFKN